MSDPRPIGFFDSGLGGASVLMQALRQLPRENYIYYGDNLNAPYGDRCEGDITALTLKSAGELLQRNVKALVIACNTATATCIRQIRAGVDIPVISVEPAIKPACMAPGSGKILMLATLATTRLERYLALQGRMPDPSRVINIPCPGVVERVERGVMGEKDFDDLFDRLLGQYSGLRIDGIVLGCTHYIFIKKAIRRYATEHFKGDCVLYDGNEATIKQLSRVLGAAGIANETGTSQIEFLTSGDADIYAPIFYSLINSGRS